MRRVVGVLGVIACMAAFAPPAMAKKNKLNPAAVALFKNAIAASDLRAKGSPGYRLQANVRIFRPHNQQLNGMVVEFWTPAGKWRDETFFQGYQLVQVSDGRHEWVKNTANYVPYEINELWTALWFPRELREWLDPIDKWSGTRGVLHLNEPKKKKKGTEVCVKAERSRWKKEKVCFDPAADQILRETDSVHITYEYSDYAAFGGKSFPRTLRVFEGDNREIVEIHITRIEPFTTPPTGTFLPVKGSQEEPDADACQTVKRAKLIKEVQPRYPPAAKRRRIEGTVVLYANVGTDGIPRGLVPLKSPSPLLTNAALQAVMQWRYRPTACEIGGSSRPVPVATHITVIFTLGSP